MLRNLGLSLLVVGWCGAALGDDDVAEQAPFKRDGITYQRWLWPVATSKESGEKVASRIARINDLLNGKLVPLTDCESNPVCCMWVEVTHWQPNPGRPGYVIIIQGGGAVLMASNIEQLDAAIKRINDVRVVKGEAVFLPLGVLTNYSVVPAEKDDTEQAK